MKRLCICTLLVAFSLLSLGTAFGQSATLTSDKSDYAPGTTATLTGAGFVENEVVTLQVLHADDGDGHGEEHEPWTVTADGNGGFVTTWHVCVDDCVGELLTATAVGESGRTASVQFTDANPQGTGQVTLTANGGSCLAGTIANPNLFQWEVAQGGSYTMTISGVTECPGSTSITAYIQNSQTGNFCITLTGSNGTFSGTFTMPNSCNTSPISYKCDQVCSIANTFDAKGPNGESSVHLRANTFTNGCASRTVDTNCGPGGCPAPPVLAGCDGGTTDLHCNPTPPQCKPVTATDCQGPVNVICTPSAVIEDGCSRRQTFTYTATGSGGPSTCVETYVWTVDTTNPVITLGAAGSIPCNPTDAEIEAAFGAATVSDNCSTGLTATGSVGAETGSGCSFSKTKTWTVTDGCGNTGTASQTVNYSRDTEDPVITLTPAGELPCNPTDAEIEAAFGTASVSDNCSTGLTATGSVGAETGSGCSFSKTKTWTVTDGCGNTGTASQTVNYSRDTEDPVITLTPAGTLPCNPTSDQIALAFGTASVTDNCTDGLIATGTVEAEQGSGCDFSTTKTWTVTDDCGNTGTASQTVNYTRDTQPPTLSTPSPLSGVCGTTPPAFTPPTASDNCDDAPVVSQVGNDVRVDGACGAYTLTRTWKATDACNNESETKSQTLTVSCEQRVCVVKFYDANANGTQDSGEPCIAGWPVLVSGPSGTQTGLTTSNCLAPVCFTGLTAGNYTVSEGTKTGWRPTTSTSCNFSVNCQQPANQSCTFGNVCLGGGGGLTLGFWSNKNGKATVCANDPAWRNVLNGLNLRNANGTDFVIPTTGACANAHATLNTWLLSANATNMAYMLSAQLAAMQLNVLSGGVNGSAKVFAGTAPAGCPVAGLNGAGFISINDLIAAANSLLLSYPTTVVPSPQRSCQEFVKNALDNANNDKNFVQAQPCNLGASATVASNPASPDAEADEIQSDLRVFRAAPNPFTNTTQLEYVVGAGGGATRIAVFDIAGRQIRGLVNTFQAAGRYSVEWNGRNDAGIAMAKGVYFVHGMIGGQSISTRVLFMP